MGRCTCADATWVAQAKELQHDKADAADWLVSLTQMAGFPQEATLLPASSGGPPRQALR